MSKPILWIVIPCYNEEQVLPITAPMFLEKISGLAAQGLVSACHHDTGSESGKYSLNIAANLFFQEKHAGCPCSRSQKRNQKTGYNA